MKNDIKKKIIEFNKQFGINTQFITDENVLGYALGNTIYINESCDQNYEKTNKHELLHFFEEEEKFKEIKQNLLEKFRDKLDEISKQLYAEYKHIVDLMKGLNYEPAFKCMMLRETLTKTYKLDKDQHKKEEKTIVKNRDLNKSISGHMIFNEVTLDIINKNINNIEQYKNFANLYFVAVEIYKQSIAEKSKINLDGVSTYEKGKWLKFNGKATDEENYIENSKKLAALVQDTPWCTKQLASSQLAEGDFYVFIDNDGKPHIAVKTTGNEIDEVRGIQNGNAQELEDEYYKIPSNVIKAIEKNKSQEYIFKLNENIELKEQKLLEETRAILFNLFRDYLASPQQKEKIIEIQNKERQKLEIEKRQKYNPDEIFKKNIAEEKCNFKN